MAVEAMIEINMVRYSLKIMDVINVFEKIGWKCLNSNNKVEYLPLGDDDDYDWQEKDISKEELNKLIELKQESTEKIGINMFYDNGEEGVTLLADDTKQIILSLSINRKTLSNTEHTDIAWYMEHIIQKLIQEKCEIDYYKIEEYRD